MENRPGVGIAAILVNEKNEVLLGLRKSKLGNNTWGFPGGKLNYGEDIIDCIVREVKEETDLIIDNMEYIGTTNDIMLEDNQHYITMFFSTTTFNGKLKLNEPDKCIEWKWFKPKELPENLFTPVINFINGNIFTPNSY